MRMSVRIATNLSLPKDLVDELDELAGKRNRSAFVERVLERELRRERMRRAWQAARGMLSPDEYPEWATPELVQQWVRDRRTETTDPGPDA
jgi:predicted transcriptional regulator